MIIVRLQGGLGNQMFQYAAAKSLAIDKKQELVIDVSAFENDANITKRKFELDCFTITAGFLSAEKLRRKLKTPSLFQKILTRAIPYYKRSIYFEPHFHYDENFFRAPADTMLFGYWQTEKYFSSITPVIREEFRIKKPLSDATLNIAKKIDETESVSVHFRRGDYISNPATLKVHGICDLEYYEKAIARITKETPVKHLYIFSDDISWARENLNLSLPTTFVDHNNEQHAYEDLFLMSKCKHNIIANSTFSWWAAWLNNNPSKKVIVPQSWFREFDADTKDLYPEEWIKISN